MVLFLALTYFLDNGSPKQYYCVTNKVKTEHFKVIVPTFKNVSPTLQEGCLIVVTNIAVVISETVSRKLDSKKSIHLLAMLKRGKYQPFKVNKARITVSSCLSTILGIKNTTKISTAKPTVSSISLHLQ